jgi:hypothetical protein
MLLHDKIVWYDKVLRHHGARMLSGFYSRDGWAHVLRVYGVDNELLKLLTKPKSMTVEENKMILNSMVYAARELERFHMLHMSDGYSLRWYAKQFSVYGKPFKDGLGRDCEVFVIESRKPGGLVKAKKIVLDRQ